MEEMKPLEEEWISNQRLKRPQEGGEEEAESRIVTALDESGDSHDAVEESSCQRYLLLYFNGKLPHDWNRHDEHDQPVNHIWNAHPASHSHQVDTFSGV